MNQSSEFSENDRLAFNCEYVDPHAELMREYIVFYYPYSKSIEMFDTKQHRLFLKKTSCSNLSLADFQLCTSVYIFGRSLFIRDYADDYTKKKLYSLVTSLTLWVPQEDFSKLFKTLSKIHLQAIRYMCITPTIMKTFQNQLPAAFRSGPCFLLRINDSDSLNVADWTIMQEHIFQELIKIPRTSNTAKEVATSLLIIKPHAVLEGNTFPILKCVLEQGFQILDLQMFTLSKADADDFLEIYKGVLPEYQ
ncbi:Nucleoside diphosphate kinase 7, partial [Coelomomyces lativittatus]